ncbi:hypothetical protein [Orrella daihaiensis]|uniref:Uncharacterized protein n=1 Tax=Orrella daihaiensis TaxID=2782176 RepID=A0ABY4ALV9_9BURK|nr:hypothetical protein [Orrella daihaiensis]UOD51300.1 hypothetical protein DHf2319_05540 [Orrella daihaiensis]
MPVSKTSTTQRKSSGSGAVSKTANKTASKVTGRTVNKTTSKTPVKTSPAKPAPVKTVTKAASKAATKAPTKKAAAQKPAATSNSDKVTLRGRSVFLVQTTSAGVTVRTAWLSEDKTLRDMVAVFPDVNYAVTLIDDLKREVLKHFSQAAQVGARAIASQRATKAK